MDLRKEELHDSNWAVKLSKNYPARLNQSNVSVMSLIPADSKSILDVGCGVGTLIKSLKEKGLTVEGVDISSVALAKARESGLKVKLADLDEKLPYKDNSFDCVLSNQVLMHILDPKKLVLEMKRVSGKYVIFNVPNHLYWRLRFSLFFGKMPPIFGGISPHISFFNMQKVLDLVSSANLKIVKFDYTGKKFWPSLFSTSITVLCEKTGKKIKDH